MILAMIPNRNDPGNKPEQGEWEECEGNLTIINVCWISRPRLIVMLNMLEYHRGHFFEKGFVKMDIKSL